MTIQYVDQDGTLVIPGGYAKWSVSPSNNGLATRGVVCLVGEAAMGNSYSEEESGLGGASFGPGQFKSVALQYGSGPLVDAFRVACNPSRDPAIRGAPTRIICVKTNTGTKATGTFTGAYAVARAKSAGAWGNLISCQVTAAVAEVVPSITSGFIYLDDTESISLAANGGTAVVLDVTGITPAAFVTDNAAALAAEDIALTGGVKSQPALGLVMVTAGVVAVGNVITISLTGGTWSSQPATGAILEIADTSPITGGSNQNSGQYIVTSSSTTGLVATKIIDLDGATLTPPVTIAPGATADVGLLDAYSQLVFTNAAADVPGLGRTLTLYRDGTSASAHLFQSATPVTASQFITSTTEAARNILVNRSVDSLSESFRVGGNIVMSIGRVGVSAIPVVVGAVDINFNSSEFVIVKTDLATLGDLAARINAQPNWYATVPAAFRSLPLSVLDQGTFDARQNGVVSTGPARVKKDAYDVAAKLATSRGIELVTAPTAGMPAVQATFFLAGGAKGATTDLAVAAALEAAGQTRCNFVVPLFARDATSDIADGLTDAASTYTIDGINSYVSEHVTAYSKFKKRRPRQGFCSKKTTFALAQTAAQTLANPRLLMGFQDVVALGANGTQWFQPWMGSVVAAGMQAAGFYQPVFNKAIAITGVTQAAGDFDCQDDDQVEVALSAGLSVIRERDGGGFAFVSDQTTYTVDGNFVYNSVQAQYISDLISQTVAQRMELAFVGRSFADVSASAALSYLKGIMADLKRLKLITSSDDAVEGYRNAVITISPPAMRVSAEVKIASGLYFCVVDFLMSETTQVASQG